MAYGNLDPGLYVANGKNIKSVVDGDLWRTMFSSSNGRDASETTIAATVAWVYAALSFRQEVLGQIEYKWQIGGEDIEETDLPFAFDTMGYIKRADKAIQMCGNAYLYKLMNGRSRVVGLRWLDPRQVKPDESSLKNYIDGYTIYRYNADKEPNKPLPSDKIIRTFIQGLNELDPDGAAAKAYNLAAQIIWGMDSVGNSFYDTNALPLMMISVPDSAGQDEINSAKSDFKRIFQRLRDGRGNKVAAMRQGTTVTPLSFAPKDLAQDTLREAEILSILAAMEVPAALMYRDVNRAEAEEKYRQFVGVMGSRFNMLAQALNSDPLFKANNLTLNVMVNEHPSMQRDEEKAAITALRFVEVGMTPAAALYKVGIDLADFPKEIEVLRDEKIVIDTPSPAVIPEMEPEDSGIGADEVKAKLDRVDAMLETLSESIKAMTTPQPLTVGVEDAPDERQAEIKALQNFIKKGTHRKRPFVSNILDEEEITAFIKAATPDKRPFDAELMAIEERGAAAIAKNLAKQRRCLIEGLTENNLNNILNKQDCADGLDAALMTFVTDAALFGADKGAETIEREVFGVKANLAEIAVIDWELANTAATQWAADYVAQLVTGINQTTRERIAKEIAAFTQSKETLPDLIKRLSAPNGPFSPQRAELIATTETTRAYAEGNTAAWKESKVVNGRQWQTTRDELVCPICSPLNGKIVGVNEEFGTGLENPPAHPRCRCFLTPVVITEGEVE